MLNYLIDFILDIIRDYGKLGVTFVLGLCANWIVFRVRYANFTKVFGKTARSSKNLFICVTLWEVREAARNVKRFDKPGPGYYGPTETLAYGDIKACQEIEALFGQFFKEPVKIVLDWEQFDLTKCSGIILGALNEKTRKLISEVYDSPIGIVETQETDEHPSSIIIVDKFNNESFDSSGEREFSAIVRMPNPVCPKSRIFLVFGAHAPGTTAAANYLRKNWRYFLNSQSHAAIILSMPRDDADLAAVVRVIGVPALKKFQGF
jgi:hypothetical protein